MARTTKRPYTGSKRLDRSCRNGGDCPWCIGNRTHATRRRAPAPDDNPTT